MRYIDSGSRNPQDALGTWLGSELIGVAPLTALRVQTGFFGSQMLGYFEDALTALRRTDGHTRLLIGSNDGQTRRSAVADLLAVVGHPRDGLRVGVVSFQSGFFHPKVFHIQRFDGSSTAYVGSANLTVPGTTSLHVEAGVILDDRKGDPTDVLESISAAIDVWFSTKRPGLYDVVDDADLDALVEARVLGVVPPPRPPRTVRPVESDGTGTTPSHSLKPLVAAPPVRHSLAQTAALRATQPTNDTTADTPAIPPVTPAPPSKLAAAKHWGKKLSDSDAQRKKTGNQRGAITLVQGDYKGEIDQTTYFRNDLFGQQTWVPTSARTGQPIEVATVPMNVTIDGVYHGILDFEVTNGSSRQAGQNNYTAELHIEPIGSILRQTNIARKHLDITLDNDGTFWLTIA
ncbi:phospholipase D family protein [Nakamurella leprariae]|uniref:Phospholipase D family protein n=1 Tax=Nakamurella leprariae TaxID=2803911 RepID=A0A938YFI5_9ACTN|nr:phospholipase D family protein [Nakamurella leprariae]MBM9467467.1 phospholipase D family protein [Nakamurella leprariae]